MKTFQEMTEAERFEVGMIAEIIDHLVEAAEWAVALRADRDAAINRLRVLGWSMADVAAVSGLSQPMIQRIGEKGGIRSVRRAVQYGSNAGPQRVPLRLLPGDPAPGSD